MDIYIITAFFESLYFDIISEILRLGATNYVDFFDVLFFVFCLGSKIPQARTFIRAYRGRVFLQVIHQSNHKVSKSIMYAINTQKGAYIIFQGIWIKIFHLFLYSLTSFNLANIAPYT